jgi:hypothetical protein
MKGNKILHGIAIASLVILLVMEYAWNFDTFQRRVALSLTCIVGGLAYLGLWAVARKQDIHFPGIVSILVAASIWFDGGANFWQLFGRILWWDKMAHFTGSFAPAAVFLTYFFQLNLKGRIRLPHFLIGLFSVSMVSLLCVLYEVSEYWGDVWFGTHRVTDLFDTSDDLMYNTASAVFVVIVFFVWRRLKAKPNVKQIN